MKHNIISVVKEDSWTRLRINDVWIKCEAQSLASDGLRGCLGYKRNEKRKKRIKLLGLI